MRRLRDLFGTADRLRYLAWKASRTRGAAVFRLKGGPRISLRPEPATDATTAYEIFVAEVYRTVGPAPDRSFKRVVDVGANVGYSLLYWGERYPGAEIIAFEPHPIHVDCLKTNLALNGLSARVTLHAAAACASDGTVSFSSEEHCSSVVADGSNSALRVPAVDFFSVVKGEIDLLKMDIEGGEYELLADPRFASLQARTIVLEWHRTDAHPDGRDWCTKRLQELGYVVTPGLWSSEPNGLLWGFREASVEKALA